MRAIAIRSPRIERTLPALTPSPLSPAARTTIELGRDLAELGDLDIHELRLRWRQRLRTTPPAALNRPLLLRLLAYRLQARVLGDLDPETSKLLDQVARDNARRRTAENRPKPKAVPIVPPVPRDRGLKPGTLLVREHAGVMHRVMVMADGFAWSGTTYTNLSEIARAVTGTRWNGPRFFGLRDRVSSPGNGTQTTTNACQAEVVA